MSAQPIHDSAPVEVLFARTNAGFLAAKAGENAFAMLPRSQNRLHIAYAWKLPGPIEDWKRSDFHGQSGELKDEAAFRAQLHEMRNISVSLLCFRAAISLCTYRRLGDCRSRQRSMPRA